MSPRKRRRSQAFPETDNVVGSPVDADEHPDFTDRSEKEREVWDAFREEHFEIIEQMPLTLHRQYTLIHELEQQSVSYTAGLLSTLKQYIKKRREMMHKFHSNRATTNIGENDAAAQLVGLDVEAETREEFTINPTPPVANGSTSPSGNPPRTQSPVDLRTHTSLSIPPDLTKTPRTTRQMLSHIGYLTEELLRASDEKVNLAQASYESVNRHARILEHAVKEQEASIFSGARPGHLEVLNLPQLVPPRWARTALTTPTHDDEFEPLLGEDQVDHEDAVVDEPPQPPLGTRGRRRGFRGKRGKGGTPGEPGQLDGHGTSLTITLPGLVNVGDPEETYCRCRRISFGEMVGCDNDGCEEKWFHLGCVGLTEAPPEDEDWFCSHECEAAAKNLPPPRKRKRK